MIFSYNLLQSFFSRKLLKPEKLAELLTLRSFEVQDLKKVKSDYALDIDILPNRAGDCFSHFGVAREIAAVANLKLSTGAEKVKLLEDKKNSAKNFVSVEVKSRSYCPRYTARVISDVKVGPSPKWLRDRLGICGLNSINNIVDVANYVMLETGQPLHAFDLEKLEYQPSGRAPEIIVRHAKEGEKITTLDNQEFDLNPKILVIADAKKPIAIAGIKGGKAPEISGSTKTIVLESANFNPAIIRKGSRELNLKTDASLRFEHGIDPNLTEFAINRAAYWVQKLAGGKVYQNLVDFYPQKTYPKKVKLDLNYAENLLGIPINAGEVKGILNRLSFKVTGSRNPFRVEVPTFRLDVLIPEDLIEELGRIFGYEKIPAAFPMASLITPKRNDNIFWENMAKDILKESGFTEVYNYSFQKDLLIGSFRWLESVSRGRSKAGQESGLVEIENPASQEYKYLRPSLMPNLLKNIEKNINNFGQIKIFELGKIFKEKTEKRMLTGLAAGQDFYQLKGIMDSLFNKLGIAKVWYDDYQATPEDSFKSLWNQKKSAEIKVGDTEVGFLGELRGDLKLVAFDLDFEKLETLANEEHEYRPISKYPATIRDLAVLVPPLTRVDAVLNVIEVAGGELIIDVDLFDIYEGEEISEGKKNLAFHIVYQAKDRTLTSIEVYKIHQKIIKALEENPEWQVRR